MPAFCYNTNNLAEFRALLYGIILCIRMGYDHNAIQTDTTMVVQWATKMVSIPWILSPWWRLIHGLLDRVSTTQLSMFT